MSVQKKSGNLLKAPPIYIYIYIYIWTEQSSIRLVLEGLKEKYNQVEKVSAFQWP